MEDALSGLIHYQAADYINEVPVNAATPLPVIGSVGGAAISASNPQPVYQPVTLADFSVTSATGASQTLRPANTARKAIKISNPNVSGSWWIDDTGGTAVANGAACFELPPGSEWAPVSVPLNAITGIGASSAKLRVKEG